jgi:hypothetical protein
LRASFRLEVRLDDFLFHVTKYAPLNQLLQVRTTAT